MPAAPWQACAATRPTVEPCRPGRHDGVRHRPAHDASAYQIHHRGQVQPALASRHVRDVSYPGLIGLPVIEVHRIQLPLLKDVGWAVIDYIRHGRPTADYRQIFLRHTAPIGPFSDQDHLHQILVKHARVARVTLSDHRRHGMHSLRHTLATRLMEGGTPIEEIADILGHQSVVTTGVYLKTSLGLLRQCALNPDATSEEAL